MCHGVPLFTDLGSELSPNGLPEGRVQHMVGIYDYDPQVLSPNVDSEVKHGSWGEK